ncbi:MAG: hypothetical protein ACI9WU_005525 [Myxococcota bacterium]|jgi:hypothetical protein
MDQLIERVVAQSGVPSGVYLAALNGEGFEREDFAEIQLQLFHLASGWDRLLGLLSSQLPGASLRRAANRGAWDGPTDEDAFVGFLDALGGLSLEDVRRRFQWPEVKAFESALMGAMVDDWRLGASCLGVVEQLMGSVAEATAAAARRRGWVEGDVPYYDVQGRWKRGQAKALFGLVRSRFEGGDLADRYPIALGARVGALEVRRLLDALYEARARRIWVR